MCISFLERKISHGFTGLYIMQNTMVRGGRWPAGNKIKLGVREKKEKGKEKRRKLH